MKGPLVFMLMVGLALVLAAPVQAGPSVEDLVDDRMDAMKGMERALRDISDSLAGVLPYDPSEALKQAKQVQGECGKIIQRFPKGSLTEDSDALPKIWKQKKKFDKRAKEATKRAGQLVRAVKADDRGRVADTLKKLNKTCSNCHSVFRKR